MRHVNIMRRAVAEGLSLTEAERREAIARHDAVMAKLHAKMRGDLS